LALLWIHVMQLLLLFELQFVEPIITIVTIHIFIAATFVTTVLYLVCISLVDHLYMTTRLWCDSRWNFVPNVARPSWYKVCRFCWKSLALLHLLHTNPRNNIAPYLVCRLGCPLISLYCYWDCSSTVFSYVTFLPYWVAYYTVQLFWCQGHAHYRFCPQTQRSHYCTKRQSVITVRCFSWELICSNILIWELLHSY
jgi:hypothetical protein